MAAADLLSLLISVNLAAAAAVALALALRAPARRWFGPRLAYGVWLIVPFAVLAGLLPARTNSLPVASAPFRAVSDSVVREFLVAPDATRPLLNPAMIILALWFAGVAVSLALLFIGQARAKARFGALTRQADGHYRAARPAVGPALIGLMRPRIVTPADFETQFDEAERALVLAHERAHLAGGHLKINLLTALGRSLTWFNPLAYLGAFYARVDQELACDAAVVERFPGERRTYARALLKSQLVQAPLPLGCFWPGRSPNLLRERIEMLASTKPNRLRRVAGIGALAALCAGAGFAAWAAQDQDVKIDVLLPQAEAKVDVLLPQGVNLTNAGSGQLLTWGSHRGSRAERLAAIEAGRAMDVFTAGGTAEEVLAAMNNEYGEQPEALTPVPGSAQFAVEPMAGYVGVTFMSKGEGRIFSPVSTSVPVAPPPGAADYAALLGVTPEAFRAGLAVVQPKMVAERP